MSQVRASLAAVQATRQVIGPDFLADLGVTITAAHADGEDYVLTVDGTLSEAQVTEARRRLTATPDDRLASLEQEVADLRAQVAALQAESEAAPTKTATTQAARTKRTTKGA